MMLLLFDFIFDFDVCVLVGVIWCGDLILFEVMWMYLVCFIVINLEFWVVIIVNLGV